MATNERDKNQRPNSEELGNQVSRAVNRAADKAEDAVDRTQAAAARAADKIEDKVDQAMASATRATDKVEDKVERAADESHWQISTLADKLEQRSDSGSTTGTGQDTWQNGTMGNQGTGQQTRANMPDADQVKHEVKQQATQVASAVQEQANAMLNNQLTRVTDSVGGVADAIRQAGSHLREQDQPMVAQYADRAAEQLDDLTSYLRNGDIGQFLHDATDLARREPTLFIGTAFAAGLFLSRFLKSSRPAEYPLARRDSYTERGYESYQGRPGTWRDNRYQGRDYPRNDYRAEERYRASTRDRDTMGGYGSERRWNNNEGFDRTGGSDNWREGREGMGQNRGMGNRRDDSDTRGGR